MYLRFVRLAVREGSEAAFQRFYRERVQLALAEVPGCLFAGLLAPWRSDEHRSLTLWRAAEDAAAYEASGLFRDLARESEPFLTRRAVWRVRLAEESAGDETVAAAPAAPVPREGFEIAAGDSPDRLGESAGSFYVRVVSLRLDPAARGEFERLYREAILPAVHEFAGCLGAFLAEGAANEALSITVWEREEQATRYEMSGEFERLTRRIEKTFSPHLAWRVQLADGDRVNRPAPEVATFHLVLARPFARR